jgi:alpha-tubulin suppressor-like RCC1 family protein
LSDVVQIAAGGTNALALKGNGKVWAWGGGVATAAKVDGLSDVTQIAVGGGDDFAVKSDGTVWAWGSNDFGQIGNGTVGGYVPTPTEVSGLSGVTQVGAGPESVLALKSDGTVWAWGLNYYGELGNGQTATLGPYGCYCIPTAAPVGGLSGVARVAAGDEDSVVLKSDGTVWAWGRNDFGEVGTTMRFCTPTSCPTGVPAPTQVSGLSGTTAIAAGWYHTMALRSDGTVWAWGLNEFGEVGNGTTTSSATPTQVAELAGVTQIAGGTEHSLAVT